MPCRLQEGARIWKCLVGGALVLLIATSSQRIKMEIEWGHLEKIRKTVTFDLVTTFIINLD